MFPSRNPLYFVSPGFPNVSLLLEQQKKISTNVLSRHKLYLRRVGNYCNNFSHNISFEIIPMGLTLK